MRFLGGMPVSHEHSRGGNSSDGLRRPKGPPDVTKYGPTAFAALVNRLSGRRVNFEGRDDALKAWLHYWKERNKGTEALRAIDRYFNEAENPYPAEGILDEVFLVSIAVQGKKTAYKWLVRAHIYRHGWQSSWTSSEEVVRRLGWAAKYYKARWRDYIQDTSKRGRYWEKRGYGISIGGKYLVRFLLLVDQKNLAAQVTDTFVKTTVAQLADQPIPDCTWLR
jgi:hypothetical protein